MIREDKYHYDCSKLDQWQILFDHAQSKGLYAHFKTQENESDDNRIGHKQNNGVVIESLDGGKLGPQRKIYYHELIARYGYLLALNWNLEEENTQSIKEKKNLFKYIDDVTPYNQNIVVHTFPNEQDKIYRALLSDQSMTGASLQNSWDHVHKRTLLWIDESTKAPRPWVTANDEQNSAGLGTPPDPGYQGFVAENLGYDLHDIRKQTLWGNLMAGGAGVEYYFGYKLPENDLICEDFRSRDRSWEYAKIAIDFYNNSGLSFLEMTNQNNLIGNANNEKEKYCLAKEGEFYLAYLGYTDTSSLDLSGVKGSFNVTWFNPRTGENNLKGKVKKVKGGSMVELGTAPKNTYKDWLVFIKKK
ncbi:MAG: hypothetical protein ACJA2S_001420 [Cyclobacteriaceae bacterium]